MVLYGDHLAKYPKKENIYTLIGTDNISNKTSIDTQIHAEPVYPNCGFNHLLK